MKAIPKDKILIEKNIDESDAKNLEINVLPPDDVFAYNELRSCADLFRLHVEGDLEIKPDFQREGVWKNSDKTRFVDSLLKGLPIPSMCFSLGKNTQHWKVIDGLQRMLTISSFLNTEKEWQLSILDDIDPRLSGKSNLEIQKKYPNIFKQVENLTLPITVIRCDYENKMHDEYLFLIFSRLNTGGMKLSPQEIRNGIYSGNFNTLLKELAQDSKFRKVYKLSGKVSQRMNDTEFVLRVFVFSSLLNEYKGKLTKFLNDFMYEHRDLKQKDLDQYRNHFIEASTLLYDNVISKSEETKLESATLREAIMVGVYVNLKTLKKRTSKEILAFYKKFKSHPSVDPVKLSEGVWKRERVEERFKAAISIFAGN